MSDLILYTNEDGSTRLDLRIEGGTAWLNQLETAALFATTKNNVSLHVRNLFQEGELTHEATVKESLTFQIEGNAEANAEDLREIENLERREPEMKKANKNWLYFPSLGLLPFYLRARVDR